MDLGDDRATSGRLRRWTARPVVRDSLGVALATGAYGTSFGAVALAGGLDVWQAMGLSLLMFSGGSQFGLVGVIAGGGSPWSGVATAVLLGARNAFYGLRLSRVLELRGWRRALAAQVVIDESSAMSMARADRSEERTGFYVTGVGVYLLWNLGTLVGALGASALSDPRVLGLDAAAPAAFVALLGPRLRDRSTWAVALAGAALAVATTPVLPPGLPVLVAGLFALVVGLWPRRGGGEATR
ncbi:AzlC family ABC transporter permease [Nakamurella endophytica]|uniref:Branched-chain amino acid ABC transporter permease n=1 Tax=Nakamurella endophytica TaxID=1748367 RepID=A0A917SQ15_9ACTN|nr:AzlC family ABC transporter permease [Nakamurella endophytica]GGL93257.1 branched-chain amino acid ABC transporter permease [Nakamurella endophytica]